MNRRGIKRLGLYVLLIVVAAVLLGLAINTSSKRGAPPEPRPAEAGSLQSHSASSQPGMGNADSAASNLVHSKNAGLPLTRTQNKADRGLVRASEADYVMDATAIMDLCSHPDLEKTLSVDDMIAYEKLAHGTDSAVAATTEHTLAILCSRDWKIPPFDPKAIATGDAYAFFANNSRPFQDSIVFIDLLQSADGADIPDKERSRFVVGKIKSADGLYELLATLNLFDQAGVLPSALIRYGYPAGIPGDALGAASIIASCRIFDLCGPYSPFAARLCFLLCNHPMSAPEYAMSRLPDSARDQVEQAANAIVAARFLPGEP